MSRGLCYTNILFFVAASVAIIAARPEWVGDQNSFLKNFVNHEFLESAWGYIGNHTCLGCQCASRI